MHTITLSIFDHLLKEARLVVLDCGASGGGEEARWRFLGSHVEIHAFDADAIECERLEEKARREGLNIRYWPIFLGRTEKGRTLHIGRDRFNVSFLKPNFAALDRLKDTTPDGNRTAGEGQRTVDAPTVDTTGLDDWAAENGIEDVDFIKNDIEGLELELMEASPKMVSCSLGVFVDVVFTECWIGTPQVIEPEQVFRGLGFSLVDICRPKRAGRFASPYTAPGGSVTRPGQITNADFLYLRDPIAPGAPAMSFEKALKLACIAEVMGQIEYAFEILTWLRDRESDASRKAVIAGLIDGAARYYTNRDRPFIRAVLALRTAIAQRLPGPIVSLMRPLDRLFTLR